MATKSIDPNPVPSPELPPVDGDPPAWAEVRKYANACPNDYICLTQLEDPTTSLRLS